VNRFSLIISEPFLRFNRSYREELRKAENLTLLLNADVTEIEANDSASAVSVLRVACLSGTKFSVRAKIFILALGGIENPRLLLLSNKIQSAGPGNGEDLVGRFFMEHPRFDAGVIVPQTPQIQTRFYQQHTVGDTDLIGYIGLSDDTMREEKLTGVIARITPVYDPAFEKALASPELTR
jgi:choline dehydrogenase-like flavoprotein